MSDNPELIPRTGNTPERVYMRFPGVRNKAAISVLIRAGIPSLSSLRRLSESEWENLPGLSVVGVRELRDAMLNRDKRARGPR